MPKRGTVNCRGGGIRLGKERVLTTHEAAAYAKVQDSVTIWDWIVKGRRGHYLRAQKVVGRWVTSEEAIEEFIDAVNGRTAEAQKRARTPIERPLSASDRAAAAMARIEAARAAERAGKR